MSRLLDIKPDQVPEGSTFKGYREVVIQDIVFKIYNTRYPLAQYKTGEQAFLPTVYNTKH